MKLEPLIIDELKEAVRNQGIHDLADVRFGVLEPDGRFSFISFDDKDEERGSPDRAFRLA